MTKIKRDKERQKIPIITNFNNTKNEEFFIEVTTAKGERKIVPKNAIVEIINNLVDGGTDKALSAEMGKILNTDASETQRGLVNTNTITAQQLGNGNKIIKGGATGNAFEIQTNNNQKIAEFLATKGVIFYSNSFAGASLRLKSSYYNNDTFWNTGDGLFRFITDPQSNTVWFGGSNTMLEYRRIQSFYKIHLQSPDASSDNKGVIEISNHRGAVLAGSHNLHLRVNASSYNVGNDVLTILTNQNVGIGTTTPQAKLEVSSTTQGFLPPRMTQAQREAISLPATGLVVYQTNGTEPTGEGLYVKQATGWVRLVNG